MSGIGEMRPRRTRKGAVLAAAIIGVTGCQAQGPSALLISLESELQIPQETNSLLCERGLLIQHPHDQRVGLLGGL